jgi:Uma2 family endonuclease
MAGAGICSQKGPMATTTPTYLSTSAATREGCVLLHGVSWDAYEGLLRAAGNNHPALRLTYLEGTLEILTTSPRHERFKKMIARLLEAWAEERGFRLDGYGAATFRSAAASRGLEPDECYALGELGDAPDLAIEVVETHGDIDKLEVYAGLGVREVWFWEEGRLVVHHLEGRGYVESTTSRLLPGLDLTELVTFVRESDQTASVRAYRRALRGT